MFAAPQGPLFVAVIAAAWLVEAKSKTNRTVNTARSSFIFMVSFVMFNGELLCPSAVVA